MDMKTFTFFVCILLSDYAPYIIMTTVKPPNNGHTWDPAFCPLKRGCPLSEVILYGMYILEYFGIVLSSEVCPLSECPLSEVSL